MTIEETFRRVDEWWLQSRFPLFNRKLGRWLVSRSHAADSTPHGYYFRTPQDGSQSRLIHLHRECYAINSIDGAVYRPTWGNATDDEIMEIILLL